MKNIKDVLATISEALENIREQVTFFSEPISIKQRDKVVRSVTDLETSLHALAPLLVDILVAADSEPSLRLLWVVANAAYAEVKRSHKLVTMVKLNLKPIAVPGMLRPAIQSAMEPAEERALGSSLLAMAADLRALEIHVRGVARQLKFEVDNSGERGTFQSH